MNIRINPRGSSLTEVLISLLLSSLIMAAMSSTYVSVKNHYLFLEKESDLMQEEVLLINYFKDQIQSAGFFGCNHQNKLLLDKSSLNISHASLLILNKKSKQLPLHVRRNAVSDSQILKLTSLELPLYSIDKSDIDSELITFKETTNFKKNQKIIISDCDSASFRIINKINNSKNRLVLNTPLKIKYSTSSTVGLLKTNIFYIRKVGKHRSLYLSNGQRSEELSRDILKIIINKQTSFDNSLINITLNRLNNYAISFHVSMLGN